MALSAVYYMTNYATKYDVGQHQLILTAALVKRALEDAKMAAGPSEAQLRIRGRPARRGEHISQGKMSHKSKPKAVKEIFMIRT